MWMRTILDKSEKRKKKEKEKQEADKDERIKKWWKGLSKKDKNHSRINYCFSKKDYLHMGCVLVQLINSNLINQ